MIRLKENFIIKFINKKIELLIAKLNLNEEKELKMRRVYNDFLVEIYMGLSWDVKWHKNKHIYKDLSTKIPGKNI